MSHNRHRRLATLGEYLESLPIAPAVVEAAFDRFRASGELPEEQRLAAPVIERAMRREVAPASGSFDYMRSLDDFVLLCEQAHAGQLPPDPRDNLKHVLKHAVYGSDRVRKAARRLLKMLAKAGLDPTDPHSLEEAVLPKAAKPLLRMVLEAALDPSITATESVGPPPPRGQALIDWVKDYIRMANEFGRPLKPASS